MHHLLQDTSALSPYAALFVSLLVCYLAYYYVRSRRLIAQSSKAQESLVLEDEITAREQEKREYFDLLDQEVVHDIYKEEVNKKRLEMLLEFNDDITTNKHQRILILTFIDLGDFNPTDNETLTRFNAIKKETACIYAKKAKVWGAPWNDELSARDNFIAGMPVLANFVTTLKLKRFMDAIVFEARGDQYRKEERKYEKIKAVCETFRELCLVMSAMDPCQSRFMARAPDKYPFWSLTFGDEAFFVTTFAKCYPSTHPRHSYGVDSLFILMQPEISFGVHEIPVRGPPGTPRWKIREAFKAIGQPYEHNEPAHMPVAWWFVRPIDINTDNLLRGHVTQDDEDGNPVERGYEVVPWWLPQAGYPSANDDESIRKDDEEKTNSDGEDEDAVEESD